MSEAWRERRARWELFIATPIGAAFARFENLHGRAWQKDTELGFDGCGEKTAKEAWKQADQARTELLKLLGYEEPQSEPASNEQTN